jgi:predicted RNA binding protein YcfA (HicA-like mRNA interferase family)
MGRIPALKSEEVIRVLAKAGFQTIRQRGSHVRLRHPDQRVVTVPAHLGQDLGRGILRKILRDAKLTPEEFLSLLRE